MTTDTEMSLWFERSANPAWGLFAGQAGTPAEVIINPRTPRETRRLETNRTPLRKGDTVRCYTGGGGGYGDPLRTRPPSSPIRPSPNSSGVEGHVLNTDRARTSDLG